MSWLGRKAQQFKQKVVETNDAIVDRTVATYDRVANTVMKPVTGFMVRRKVRNGLRDKMDEEVDKKVIAATNIDPEIFGSSIAIGAAREIAVQTDQAPDMSSIRRWADIAAKTVSDDVTQKGYSSAQELQQMLEKDIAENLRRDMRGREGFILDAASIQKAASQIAKQVSESYDKIPRSVTRSARRLQEQQGFIETAMKAVMPQRTASLEKAASGYEMLGELASPIIGKGQNNSIQIT